MCFRGTILVCFLRQGQEVLMATRTRWYLAQFWTQFAPPMIDGCVSMLGLVANQIPFVQILLQWVMSVLIFQVGLPSVEVPQLPVRRNGLGKCQHLSCLLSHIYLILFLFFGPINKAGQDSQLMTIILHVCFSAEVTFEYLWDLVSVQSLRWNLYNTKQVCGLRF